MFKIKVTAVVNLDGGKIVTVQKAKKDGEKSTKVTLPMTMTMIPILLFSTFSIALLNSPYFKIKNLNQLKLMAIVPPVRQRDEWGR